MPLTLFKGQLYVGSQAHPRLSEAGTRVGVGRHVQFLKSFIVDSGGTLIYM